MLPNTSSSLLVLASNFAVSIQVWGIGAYESLVWLHTNPSILPLSLWTEKSTNEVLRGQLLMWSSAINSTSISIELSVVTESYNVQ